VERLEAPTDVDQKRRYAMVSIPLKFMQRLMSAHGEQELSELMAEYPGAKPLIRELLGLLAESPGQDVATVLERHPELLGRYIRQQPELLGEFIRQQLEDE
jgi:hypothetical protein